MLAILDHWAAGIESDEASMLIDSHVHLWDAQRFPLRWTAGAGHLEGSHESSAYRLEAEPLGIQRSLVVEADVSIDQRREEADDQVARCIRGRDGILAAVPCLDPRDADFLQLATALSHFPMIRGIRWIARSGEAAQELAASSQVRHHLDGLGRLDLVFDLNVPISHLHVLPSLVRNSPGTSFVLDHVGYADPEAFRAEPRRKPSHDAATWKAAMEDLALLPNVCCKISGLANRLPAGACTAQAIAPIVEHARSVFSAKRLLFGSDWPVVGPPGHLTAWVTALRALSAGWSEQEQAELFGEAAIRWYGLRPLL